MVISGYNLHFIFTGFIGNLVILIIAILFIAP